MELTKWLLHNFKILPEYKNKIKNIKTVWWTYSDRSVLNFIEQYNADFLIFSHF